MPPPIARFPLPPVPAPGMGLGRGQGLEICTAGRTESLKSRSAGGPVGDLPPPVARFPLPPVPAPEIGLGARTRTGNPHCRKGGEPGKDLSPPPNSARLLASASEVGRGLRWRAEKRGSLLSPYPPASALPIAPLPSPLCQEGQRASPLAPLPGAGAFGGAVRRRRRRRCCLHPNPPGHSAFAPGGRRRPCSPCARLFGNRHTPPRYNRTFSTSIPLYNGEKGAARRGPPARAPLPVPGSLSPTRPAPGDKERPPGSFAGQALLSHLWYLMLPPMQKAR